MPITPFHMGPGLAFKAVGGHRFSLMLFGFSQVAIDIEPLIHMIRGDAVLHGFTHTYVGATLIGLACVFVGRPICQFLLNQWDPPPESRLEHWLRGPKEISLGAATAGAFGGTYSHIVFDSMMHLDMHPLFPFSSASPLLGLIPVGSLYLACVIAGLLGASALAVRHAIFARPAP